MIKEFVSVEVALFQIGLVSRNGRRTASQSETVHLVRRRRGSGGFRPGREPQCPVGVAGDRQSGFGVDGVDGVAHGCLHR